jgi:hypothetical protein
MAVTGYFINDSWVFQEVLLAFEPLYGSHSGVNLGKKLLEILEKYGISDRVLGITADNASNNGTLVRYMRDMGRNSHIFRVPCVAHIIQLCLTGLLDDMKIRPENETPERDWSKINKDSRLLSKEDQIIGTLTKVCK